MLALAALHPAQGEEPGHLHAGRAKKNDCRHPVPAWHGPNKRFADAAQAGLGIQCAKSRPSASLIAAAISPGWSFREPCSPCPPPSNFFFFCKACICHAYVPPRPAGPGRAEEGTGRKSTDATFIALLFPASILPLPPPAQHSLWLPVSKEPGPAAEAGTGDSIVSWPHTS